MILGSARGSRAGQAVVVLFVAALTACEDPAPPGATATAPSAASSPSDAPHAPSSSAPAAEPPRDPSEPEAAQAVSRPTTCEAPSRSAIAPIDAADSAALATCQNLRTGKERTAHRCGQEGAPPLDLASLDQSVLSFDSQTVERLRAIAAVGRRMGRNPRAIGLIGDSMTVSRHFMRPFSARADMPHELAPEVREALLTPVADSARPITIIDYYRSEPVEWVDGLHVDSFRATRAAQIGARASYALDGGDHSPAKKLIDGLNPAVAIVLFGGNDAAYRPSPPEALADGFEASFVQLLDALERNGIIPILSTLARHGRQPGVAECDEPVNNWRVAVATNAISRRVIDVACERRLPLIDLRHAMDAADNRGLGADGVHPSFFLGGGAGALTEQGLMCGYNVRNYLTLRMLKEVKEQVLDHDDTVRVSAAPVD